MTSCFSPGQIFFIEIYLFTFWHLVKIIQLKKNIGRNIANFSTKKNEFDNLSRCLTIRTFVFYF